MARPLRIEFPGALYHITARGDRQEPVFYDDDDRVAFLETLREVVRRYQWLCHAYCLMGNHYHLIVETPEANLSKGMRQLNGVYTQSFNRRHRVSGHLFQGRFGAVLVDRDSHLVELSRYVVLNPVRANLVDEPVEWPWSSYRAMVGETQVPEWLTTDWLLQQFGATRREAQKRYQEFVALGRSTTAPWRHLRQQIYLGDEDFVSRMQANARVEGDELSVPQGQRRPPAPSLATLAGRFVNRNDAIEAAYATGAYSYREIGTYFGLHPGTVGRIVRQRMLQNET